MMLGKLQTSSQGLISGGSLLAEWLEVVRTTPTPFHGGPGSQSAGLNTFVLALRTRNRSGLSAESLVRIS